MSVSKVIAAKKSSFAYRNIKKDYSKFKATPIVTKNAHLELGEHYETKIVQDRNDDWFEFQQQGVDSVGVKNIIDLLSKRREDPFDGRFMFKDSEASDTSMIDPMNPAEVQRMAANTKAAQERLEALANSVGLTVDELVNGLVKGDLGQVIQSKKVVESTSDDKKEGE